MDAQKVGISFPFFLAKIAVASARESGIHAGDSANDDEAASKVAGPVALEFLQAEAPAGGPDDICQTVAETVPAFGISGISLCANFPVE